MGILNEGPGWIDMIVWVTIGFLSWWYSEDTR